jgi:hypothetical protein
MGNRGGPTPGAVLNGWDLLPWFGLEGQRLTAPIRSTLLPGLANQLREAPFQPASPFS